MRALFVLLILAGCAGKTVVTKPTEPPIERPLPAPAPPPPPPSFASPRYHDYAPRAAPRAATASPKSETKSSEPVVELMEMADLEDIETSAGPAPVARRTERRIAAPVVAVECPTLAPSVTYNCMSPPCPGPPPPPPPKPWWDDQMKVILAAISGGIGMIVTAVASRIAGIVKKAKTSEA